MRTGSEPHDVSFRESVLRDAVSKVVAQNVDDSDLLLALGKLWKAESPSARPSDILAAEWKSRSMFRKMTADPPRLSTFLFWCAQADGFGCDDGVLSSMSPMDSAALARLDARHTQTALTLAKSPWAVEIGLHLNEARPYEAPLWPLICSCAPIAPKELARISKQAGPLLSQHAMARDSLLTLACQTAHPPMFEMALTALRTVPLSDECIVQCAEALTRGNPHSGARKALGIESEQALESVDMAVNLAQNFADPRLDHQFLSTLCLSHMSLPQGFSSSPWKPLVDLVGSRGARELSLDDLLKMAEIASAKAAAFAARPQYGFSSRTDRVAGRDIDSEGFDSIAAACIKKAMLPRSHIVTPDQPPLAYRLLGMLENSGPKSRAAILSAMNGWALNGFGRETLAWRRSASGHTQSLGSAIAGLPKTKDPERNYTSQIALWLEALAQQGFDFEAKSSPKSKSLGEKLRENATLKEFWPLVEARLIAASSRSDAPARRPKSL